MFSVSFSRIGKGYDLEETEEKYQSMYRSSEHAEDKPDQLKVRQEAN